MFKIKKQKQTNKEEEKTNENFILFHLFQEGFGFARNRFLRRCFS